MGCVQTSSGNDQTKLAAEVAVSTSATSATSKNKNSDQHLESKTPDNETKPDLNKSANARVHDNNYNTDTEYKHEIVPGTNRASLRFNAEIAIYGYYGATQYNWSSADGENISIDPYDDKTTPTQEASTFCIVQPDFNVNLQDADDLTLNLCASRDDGLGGSRSTNYVQTVYDAESDIYYLKLGTEAQKTDYIMEFVNNQACTGQALLKRIDTSSGTSVTRYVSIGDPDGGDQAIQEVEGSENATLWNFRQLELFYNLYQLQNTSGFVLPANTIDTMATMSHMDDYLYYMNNTNYRKTTIKDSPYDPGEEPVLCITNNSFDSIKFGIIQDDEDVDAGNDIPVRLYSVIEEDGINLRAFLRATDDDNVKIDRERASDASQFWIEIKNQANPNSLGYNYKFYIYYNDSGTKKYFMYNRNVHYQDNFGNIMRALQLTTDENSKSVWTAQETQFLNQMQTYFMNYLNVNAKIHTVTYDWDNVSQGTGKFIVDSGTSNPLTATADDYDDGTEFNIICDWFNVNGNGFITRHFVISSNVSGSTRYWLPSDDSSGTLYANGTDAGTNEKFVFTQATQITETQFMSGFYQSLKTNQSITVDDSGSPPTYNMITNGLNEPTQTQNATGLQLQFFST